MNTDNFTIDSSDIELAQNICKMITDSDIRNRAVANAIASKIAAKYFDPEVYNVDTESGLHNIGIVLQDIDISDIYINDTYLDVRVFFNDEEIAIPAEHIENDLLPAAYMFIKITPDLSGALVVGFKTPENIDKSKLIDGYYKLSEEDLEAFYDVEPLLSSYNTEPIDIEDKDIFAYLDNTIDDKNIFYSALLKSKDGRLRLARAAKAQNIFKYVSINKDAMNNTSAAGSIDIEGQELAFADEFALEAEPQELVLSDTSDSLTNEENNLDLDFDIESSAEILKEENAENLVVEDSSELSSDFAAEENSVEETNNVELTEADLEVDLGTSVEEISFENQLEELDDSSNETETDFNDDTDTIPTETSENFEYTTVTSPSLNSSDDVLDELTNETDEQNSQSITNNTDQTDEKPEQQIEALFNNGNEAIDEEASPGLKVYSNKQGSKNGAIKPLLILTLLIVAGALGYTGYTKFLSAPPSDDTISSIAPDTAPAIDKVNSNKKEDAMPIETVETIDTQEDSNEATSTSIPAIEQNLDASILVSNLKVDWEVPAGYASNTSAKRYLVKLGKIIQLNLKTELLLLSKPPITNKIAVEIKFNNNSRKFEASGITISSGEKSVDDLILQTVNKALAMNLSTNTDSFAKLQGNPILIIHL